MTTVFTLLWMLPAVAVVGVLLSQFYGDSRIGTRECWAFCILGVAVIGACALIYPSWRAHPLFGGFYGLVTYNGLAWLTIAAVQPRWLAASQIWIVMAALTLTGLASAVAVWVAVVPQFGSPQGHFVDADRDSAEVTDVISESADVISESAATIESSLSAVQEGLQREQRRVDGALKKLTRAAEDRLAEVEELSEQRDRVLEELRHQEAVLQLSQQELVAFRRELRRGKVWEYFLGLLVGIVSSVCGYFLTRLVQARIR